MNNDSNKIGQKTPGAHPSSNNMNYDEEIYLQDGLSKQDDLIEEEDFYNDFGDPN